MPHRRILVIDDEEDIRDVAAMTLELTRGWAAETASCGAQGVEAAQRLLPDAILLDVMMPDMDGPATLRALQQIEATKDIPVLFLTAKVQPADLTRFQKLGIRGVIRKPFDPMALADEIDRLLE